MLDKSFKSINLLERSLNASWLKNEAISNNIANVNTPNYKREKVEFNAVLNKSISKFSIGAELTNSKHIQFSSNSDQPQIMKDYNSKARKDGNNVNVDVEMADLAKNTLYYNTVSQRVSSYFNKLRIVTKDGR